MQRTPAGQLFHNGSSNALATCNDSCYYGTHAQQYQNGHNPVGNKFWNGLETQVQAPQPSPGFTITHLNYQPMSYSYPNQPIAPCIPSLITYYIGDSKVCSSIVNPTLIHYQSEVVPLPQEDINTKFNVLTEQTLNVPNNTDLMPNTSNFTDMNKFSDYYQSNMNPGNKPMFESLAVADPETVMKFIVDNCMRAESIAGRNQHRLFFKTIQNVCSRTRFNILKPKNTVANLHSQGIPWATKDFIYAFMKLASTWFSLKGYLDEPIGNLNNIDSVLTPEFRQCYNDWENLNKKMIGHLANVFVNLDNGMNEANTRIHSSLNDIFTPTTSVEKLQPTDTVVFTTSINREKSTNTSNAKTFSSRSKGITLSEKKSNFSRTSRFKEIFNSEDDSNSDDNDHTDKDYNKDYQQSQQYIDPAIFSLSKTTVLQKNETKPHAKSVTDVTTTSNIDSNYSEHDLRESESLTQTNECICQNAVEEINNFKENQMDKNITTSTLISNNTVVSCNDIPSAENTYGTDSDMYTKQDLRNQNSPFTFSNRNCYNNEPTLDSLFSSTKSKESGLSASSKEKFENIINILLEVKFVKYITAAANNAKISENYKYINKPIYLYKIKELLTQNKYSRPEQVVHDMKSILNEANYYNKELKEKIRKITAAFSRELEFQLFEKFPTSDFSDISGESPQPLLFAHDGTHAASNYLFDLSTLI